MMMAESGAEGRGHADPGPTSPSCFALCPADRLLLCVLLSLFHASVSVHVSLIIRNNDRQRKEAENLQT